MINAAVAAAANQALDLCRRADKRINDVSRLGETSVICVHGRPALQCAATSDKQYKAPTLVSPR